MKYDYLDKLRGDLQTLDRHDPLYKLLKTELTLLGYWKNRQRGNPAAGYKAMTDKINKPQ